MYFAMVCLLFNVTYLLNDSIFANLFLATRIMSRMIDDLLVAEVPFTRQLHN